jgi:hypothetical protein
MSNYSDRAQEKQNQKEDYLNKWDDFRKRRTVEVEKYFVAKRLSAWAQTITTVICLKRFVIHAHGNIHKTK